MIQKNIDILMLQETHFDTGNLVYACRKRHKIPAWFSLGKHGSAGVAILANPNLNFSFIREEPDVDGRFLLIEIEMDGAKYVFCSVYAPCFTAQRKDFFNNMPIYMGDCNGSVIIAGDFNTTILNNKEAKERKSDASKKSLQILMDNLDMTETWKFAKDQDNRYSRKGPGGKETQIDYIFIEKSLSGSIIYLDREYMNNGKRNLSDHALITLCINKEEISKNKSCSGYWKMNTGMLEDPQIRGELDTLVEEETEKIKNFQDWIDFKEKVKSWPQETSKNLKKDRREKITFIRNLIRAIDSRDTNVENMSTKKDLESLWKEEMVKKINQRTEATLHNRIITERNFTEIFQKEKRRKKQVETPLNPPEDRQEDFVNFFKKLYSHEEVENYEKVHGLEGAATPFQIDLEKEADYQEVEDAIAMLPSGASPGKDGIPNKFYKIYRKMLAKVFRRLINAMMNGAKIPAEMKENIVTLLYKKEDPENPKNWRPITLVASDIKIITKFVANRVRKVAYNIISNEQVCGIQGRELQFNLIAIKNIIDICKNDKKKHLLLMSIDQEKAFDRIEHNFLEDHLDSIGFPKNLVNTIMDLYRGFGIRIKFPRGLSERIQVNRGIQQGSPLSAIMFIFTLEFFLNDQQQSEY